MTMNYQDTEVYRYLIYLQKYLLGDLELFHEIAKDAEKKEKALSEQAENSGCLRVFTGGTNPSTTNTVITTTQYPYSFEFIFGAPVISRSTVPNSAALFAIIDLLGFLTRTGNDYGSTSENFTTFFSHSSTTLPEYQLPVLINVYRHGIAHNYLPKLNVLVSYHSSNPDDKLFFKDNGGRLVLNVNRMERLVVDRLDEIIRDNSLYTNMDNQLGKMVRDYQRKSAASITDLLASL